MPGVIDVIEAKRDGAELSSGQIWKIVDGYTSGTVPDYQMSAFLMAVVCRGMTDDETVALTRAMVESGEVLDLSSIAGTKLDKHSTGGVGDKVSLALVPIVASAGIPIAKMSGRGLSHTGGTLDKLESINGFRVELSMNEIVEQVRAIQGCLCAQTAQIVPADKRMYALRDVTGTVPSIPLIASSIMSKKIAGGADIILLDVKVGCGAFMKTVEEAYSLAKLMVTIGESFGKTVVCELTDMDIPLGQSVGNLIEITEVANLLQGLPVDMRLRELVIALSNNALALAESTSTAEQLLEDGSAWKKFVEIVEAQGGEIASIERWNDVDTPKQVFSTVEGYVGDIDAQAIGRAAAKLGAGREVKEAGVDPLAGIWLDATVGTLVKPGQPLASLYGPSGRLSETVAREVFEAFTIEDSPRQERAIVLETMGVELLS